MPKLPGISHTQALRALSKVGFRVAREGKHTIPRHNPINPFTMAGIARDAGLTPAQFKELL